MKIELTYDEIKEFVHSNYGYTIDLKQEPSDSICIGMDVDLKWFTKYIEIIISPGIICGKSITFSFGSPNKGLNLVIKGGLMMFDSEIKEKLPMIDFREDHRAVLHLDKMDQLKEVVGRLNLIGTISFDSDSAQVGLIFSK